MQGNRTKLIYPDGKQVAYTYDLMNRLIEVDDWDTQVISYTYDASGHLLQTTLPNGVVSEYDYNEAGWLEELSHTRDGELLSSFLYEYDDIGNRTVVTETMYMLHEYAYLPLVFKDYAEGGEEMGGEGEKGSEALSTPGVEEAYPAPEMETPESSPPSQEEIYPPSDTKDETSLWQNLVDFFSKLLAWITPAASAHEESPQTVVSMPKGLQTTLPAGGVYTTTITYEYDPLYRLTNAIYSTGPAYTYTMDAVGNRLMLQTGVYTSTYLYDDANRLTYVNGITYTWDANGNLLSDGISTYTYTHANRLAAVGSPSSIAEYSYNGLGDRVSQTVDVNTTNYSIDIAAGLTQVLADSEYTYLYGMGRIGLQITTIKYILGDALGSVRQLVDADGQVNLAQSYQPYGEVLGSSGEGTTSYGFAGEWTDSYIELLYLRSRMYSPRTGRFLTKDSWQGDYTRPMSYNAWLYVYANPVNLTDPSGMSPDKGESGNEVAKFIVQRIREDSMSEAIREIRELNNTQYYEDVCDLYSRMSWWQKLGADGSRILADAAYADAGARASASAWFGCLVADARSRPVCGRWDYKKDIRDTWGEAQTVDFSVLGINKEVIFYYDIWANFHFGYLGMVGGFSEEALLTGAAVEHAASNLNIKIQDDPSDVVASLVGIQMYNSNTLSETTLLWWIYIETSNLNKAEMDKSGNIIRIYR